ncbi:hypothetical protein [Desulfitobacterium metallireducens]|uniref:Uncharacterized protein n=1 Tax=Desulfitobacterium metallireducens DSM 15288 TaxID=871968 RepID=W0E925_9FIRM|nr:hypothetical protein [Desulfitobacterium metallireducens]AHF06038.1 hypothetical protein DESME_02410 [Desulfitobacterium metallireducens DSM 15288]
MDALSSIFILAVVVEKLVELFKALVYALPFLPEKFKPMTLELISLGLGFLLAYETNINSLTLMGVKTLDPLVGVVITGLVIGKGSNFAHDFFQYVSQNKRAGG